MSTPLQRGLATRTAVPATPAREALSVRPLGAGSTYSSAYVWYVIALLFVVNAFNYMDRVALAMLAPAIQGDLDLSDGQLGMLTGFAFAVFYAVCAIPIARWADRGIRRDIIALALTTWSVMTALSGTAQSFWHLFLARVGVGAGEAGGTPPAQSLLCDYVPLERRPLVLAINSFGLGAGMMVGMGLAGWLGEWIGWRWTFIALGVPGVAFAFLVWFTLREPERGRLDAKHDDAEGVVSFGQTLRFLWHCRTYWLLMLYAPQMGFALAAIMQWGPTFVVRVHGLDLSSVGVLLGIAMGMGTGVGLLVGGFVATKAAKRDVRWPLMIGVGATVALLPATLAAFLVSSPVASVICIFLVLLVHGVASAPVVATIYSVVRARMRATAGAISIFCQSVLGFGLGPFVVGVLSDALAPSLGTQSLRYASLAPCVLFPIMVVVLYAATKAVAHDLEAAGSST